MFEKISDPFPVVMKCMGGEEWALPDETSQDD